MKWATLAMSSLIGLGCRQDAGAPDPERFLPITDPPGAVEPLPGPEPWVEGEARLSLGIFYEGGYSDRVAIDGIGTHYYIYLGAGGELTYRQVTDTDRIEGTSSDRILHGGGPWWGGGVHWDAARDLTRWTRLHVSLKSSSEAFASVQVGMGSDGVAAQVDAADYGYVADGQWHSIVIPISDLTEQGLALSAVVDPLVLGGGTGTSADSLKVDNVYLTAEPE